MNSIPLRVSRLSALASLASVLCTTTLPVWAQAGGSNKLDSVFVTATRSPQMLSQVLADVTVLTRADIERQAYGGLADLLRTQACFEMVRNGNAGANTSLYVRGAETRHTLVMLDGIRVDSQSTGGASWQSIPLAQIERVEIVRGAASAIYGSDAIGGVVQIFTRKGDGKPQLELGIGGGNNGLAKLDSVFVTATRSPQMLSQVLADVTVLTRADIERQAYGGLADLLRTQACFEMVRNGNAGANTSLYVRGAETRHTLVMLDGIRVDSQSTGGASWQSIPLAQIERVEIVRGAASAIYGSDAIGGVVQIFTRKGDGKPQLELGIGGGNNGLAKLDASVNGLVGIFDYSLSAASERSDGFNSRPTKDATYTPDIDGYRSRSVTGRVGAQLNREHRVELMGLKSHINGQYDASAKPKVGVDDRNINDARAVRGSWLAQWDQKLNTELTVGESRDRYETTPSIYLTDTRIRSATFNGSYKLGQGQLNGLLERREDTLENSSLTQSATTGRANRHQNAIAAGYVWGAGPLSLQIHGRHDKDSEFGGSNTGTVAAGYQLSSAWRVQASYGTAFRAPTLYQRFSEYGNKNLAPEHGKNTEASVLYKQGGNELGLTAYRNLIDNLIVFGAAGPCPSQFGCYANVGQARLQGVSIKAGTELAGVRLSASVDLQAPKDVTATPNYANYGRLLARRSKEHGTLRADTTVAGWNLGAQVVVSGKRFDNAANTTKLGGYALMDFDAQYSLTKQLRLQLKLDNAFDRSYQTANGYASAPRQAFIGLRYSPSL